MIEIKEPSQDEFLKIQIDRVKTTHDVTPILHVLDNNLLSLADVDMITSMFVKVIQSSDGLWLNRKYNTVDGLRNEIATLIEQGKTFSKKFGRSFNYDEAHKAYLATTQLNENNSLTTHMIVQALMPIESVANPTDLQRIVQSSDTPKELNRKHILEWLNIVLPGEEGVHNMPSGYAPFNATINSRRRIVKIQLSDNDAHKIVVTYVDRDIYRKKFVKKVEYDISTKTGKARALWQWRGWQKDEEMVFEELESTL
ncbi:hypothetical protein H2O62_09275 [Weissella cibaria]|uniref:hypothetical protein n=1 Tax=Weissella cibaria TaxID=137591 RepID=UPI0015F55C6F|nr:hypothetical protein [Weissella cibaria]MBA5963185.1 hypothetical protein [Weissella cibaria]